MKRERPIRNGFRAVSVLAYFALLLVYILFHNLLSQLGEKPRIIITIVSWSLFFAPVAVYLMRILIQDIRDSRAGFSAAVCVLLAVFLGVVIYRLAIVVPNEIHASAALNEKQAAFVTAMTDTGDQPATDAEKKAAYDEWDATQKDYDKWARQDALFLLITLVPLFAGWFILTLRDSSIAKGPRKAPPSAPPSAPPMPPVAGGPDMPPPQMPEA